MAKHSRHPGQMPPLEKHEVDAIVLYDLFVTFVAKVSVYSTETLYLVRDKIANLQVDEQTPPDYDFQAAAIKMLSTYIEEAEG